MVREIISLHVGQCGNQIGRAFWKETLQEHARANVEGVFDESMSTFFRNVDSRTNSNIAIGDGKRPISDLKARAILVDMETGPVSETNRGELGDLFDDRQFVTGVSGAGNNWAHGNAIYGPEYKDELIEVRTTLSHACVSLPPLLAGATCGPLLASPRLPRWITSNPHDLRLLDSAFPPGCAPGSRDV